MLGVLDFVGDLVDKGFAGFQAAIIYRPAVAELKRFNLLLKELIKSARYDLPLPKEGDIYGPKEFVEWRTLESPQAQEEQRYKNSIMALNSTIHIVHSLVTSPITVKDMLFDPNFITHAIEDYYDHILDLGEHLEISTNNSANMALDLYTNLASLLETRDTFDTLNGALKKLQNTTADSLSVDSAHFWGLVFKRHSLLFRLKTLLCTDPDSHQAEIEQYVSLIKDVQEQITETSDEIDKVSVEEYKRYGSNSGLTETYLSRSISCYNNAKEAAKIGINLDALKEEIRFEGA